MTAVAFGSLGFLIGNLIGLSAESALGVVLPLLFAFGGGSAAAFLHKLGPDDRRQAGIAVTALALSCLGGAYTGILVSEHQLLSPARAGDETGATGIETRKYLRTVHLDSVTLIDQRYKGNELTVDVAYERLYRYVTRNVDP